MTFDPTLLPEVLDGLHALLAVLMLLFIFLYFSRRRSPAPVSTRPDVTGKVESPAPASGKLKEISPDAALQLLALLQQEARFIDFLKEDLAGFSDADIGAAARVVHGGGQKVLMDYFRLEPIREEQEETRIALPPGFDAAAVRLTGNVLGQPPFTGMLVHRGWRAVEVRLPKMSAGHDARILAPAEVEL